MRREYERGYRPWKFAFGPLPAFARSRLLLGWNQCLSLLPLVMVALALSSSSSRVGQLGPGLLFNCCVLLHCWEARKVASAGRGWSRLCACSLQCQCHLLGYSVRQHGLERAVWRARGAVLVLAVWVHWLKSPGMDCRAQCAQHEPHLQRSAATQRNREQGPGTTPPT